MEDKKNAHETTEIRLSDGERSLLASLSNMKETVKTGHMYLNLYSQAAYSMQELAKTRDEILEEIRVLVFDSGDFAADALIESIYHELVTTFDPSGTCRKTSISHVRLCRSSRMALIRKLRPPDISGSSAGRLTG